MSQTASLQELVDLNELQAIQDSLAKTVGTSSVIFSPEGEPLTQFSNPTGFCSLIQSTEDGKRRCFLSFREMSQKALELEEPVIQYCFAHGGHFVAPIIIDGKHKGTMFAGQFIPQKFSVEQLKALEKIAVEIHVDPNLLVEEAKKMRVVEEDTVWNYSSLLFQIVAVITRLGAQADELNRAKDALQNAHDELEIRVQERTAELAKTNADLRLFSQAVDSSIEGISVGDLEGRITYVNKAFAKMFGYSSEELMGKEIALIYSEDQPPKLEKALEATMDGGWIGELVGKRKDGQLFPIAVSASQIKDDEGNVIALMASHQDITERKRTEKALTKSLRKLKESEEKLQLVGSLTRHDAGNKLFLISGFAQIAIQNTKDEVILGYLQKIVDAVEVAQNVFSFSKEYQELGVEEPQWRDISASCDVGMSNINWDPITVINDLEGLEIYTDSLIEKVFYNIADNTIRHGGGEVTEIKVFYEEVEKGLLLIYVDDGVGVPESEKEIIFERGYGANTGYGLDLIRKSLEISGMAIKETGEPGKGVRFEISVPKDRYRIMEQE